MARRFVPWRCLAAVVVAVLSGLVLLGLATPAAAHASLVGTTPRPDQVLASTPTDVALTFSDAVDLRTALVQVREPNGAPLAVEPLRHENGDPHTLAVALPADLTPGTRTVLYRVVSADGHPLQGSFRFSVGVATASATPDALVSDGGALGLALGLARWVAFVGLAVAVGTVLLVVLAWPGGLAVRAVRRILWAGLGALAVASTVSLLLYGPYVAGTGLSGVAGELGPGVATRVGTLLVVRLVLIAVLGVALAGWLRRARTAAPTHGARPALATLGGGGALTLTWSLATHGADGSRPATLPVDVVHMLAMSAWLGGMPALLVLLFRVKDTRALATAVPMFSRTAAICLVALVTTGVLQAWRQVGSATALTSTTYGGWLMVKIALVLGIVALGALARWWTVGRGPTRLGRVVAVETGLGALVLAVTATLVATQPAAAARSAALAAHASASTNRALLAASATDLTIGFRLATPAPGAEPVAYRTPLAVPEGPAKGRGFVQAVISPAFGGLPNELHVSVTDDQGRPLPVGSVLVDLRTVAGAPERSRPSPLSSSAQGHFFSAFTVPRAGPWELGITVRDVNGTEALVIVPFEARVMGA